jgi:hypothetical protein
VENHLAMDSHLVMGNYIIDRELPNGELPHEGERATTYGKLPPRFSLASGLVFGGDQIST